MNRLARLLTETTLSVVAVFGALCLAALFAGTFFGVTTLVIRSGSMAPAIHTGALAFAQKVPAADIRPGDVVSALNGQGMRIAHRVVAIENRGDGSFAMTMRGDANEATDPTDYVVSSADRIFWHAEGIGYLVPWAQKPFPMFLGGALLGAMVVSSRVRRAQPNQPMNDSGGKPGGTDVVPALLAVALLPILAVLLVPNRTTWAAFTRTATATTSFQTLTTAQLTPAFNGCSATADQVTVTWSDPSGAVPERGYALQSASSSELVSAGSSPYSWSTPLVADDLVTITAQHFASWSASLGVRITAATDGSVTCSQV